MARMVRNRSARGVAAVEAALVVPLVLMLIFGVMEYGWLFLQAHHLSLAARQGARVGITIDAVNADVVAAITTWMDGAGLGGSEYTMTFTPPDVETLGKGQMLTITVEVLYDNIGLGMPLVPLPANLRGSVSMGSEG